MRKALLSLGTVAAFLLLCSSCGKEIPESQVEATAKEQGFEVTKIENIGDLNIEKGIDLKKDECIAHFYTYSDENKAKSKYKDKTHSIELPEGVKTVLNGFGIKQISYENDTNFFYATLIGKTIFLFEKGDIKCKEPIKALAEEIKY